MPCITIANLKKKFVSSICSKQLNNGVNCHLKILIKSLIELCKNEVKSVYNRSDFQSDHILFVN